MSVSTPPRMKTSFTQPLPEGEGLRVRVIYEGVFTSVGHATHNENSLRRSAVCRRRSIFLGGDCTALSNSSLIDLEHLLDPERDPAKPAPKSLRPLRLTLLDLTTSQGTGPEDQEVAAHINRIFRSFWWGLFASYDVAGLPRTNNELERFIRQIKMGQCRVSGRKNVQDFIIRYGAYVALVDQAESLDELLVRLQQVDQPEFLKVRQQLNLTLIQEAKIHRFRFHRADFLADLEARWETAVAQSG